MESNPLVSVIVPVYNGLEYLKECLDSVFDMEYRPLELCVFDDASEEACWDLLQKYLKMDGDVVVRLKKSERGKPGGVGYARNRAIEMAKGQYFCFLDADDYNMPNRVTVQLKLAIKHPNAIVGCKFDRTPSGSTQHYADWANNLSGKDLYLQQYRECTLVMPTWFMDRKVYERVGGFDESFTSHLPEDLIFFHKHLDQKGLLIKAEECLVMYRYHKHSMSSKIKRKTMLAYRALAIQRRVICHWTSFTIWGCGRDGKSFYVALSDANKRKVKAFCDLNPAKIGTKYPCRFTKRQIPIVHFSKATAPIVCCVVMGKTNGELEANVATLNLDNGQDLWHLI